jgi:hypothetical protein
MHRLACLLGPAIVVGILTTTQASAQSPTLGMGLGVTRSTLDVNPEIGYGPSYGRITGFFGGLGIGIPLNTAWSLHTEVDVIGKGTRGDPHEVTMRATYLEVPLYVRLNLGDSSAGFFPSVLVGGSLALEVHCGGRRPPSFPGTGPMPSSVALDCAEMRSDKWDVGAILGLGAGWRDDARTWRAEVRYGYGFKDIGSVWETVDISNRSLSGTLWLEMPLTSIRR